MASDNNLVTAVNYLDKPYKLFAYTGLFCVAIATLLWLINGRDFSTGLIISLSIGMSINSAFYFLGDVFTRLINPYLAAIPITAIGLAIGLVVGGTLGLGEPLYFFAANEGTLAAGVFFGVLGFIIFSTRGRLIAAESQLAQASALQARQEKLLTEAELKLLQAQIEPHFLFNTLSNIAGLIHRDPDTAELTLINLTTLLRASLKRTREVTTTLREELEIARAYLNIQSTRMGSRLEYTIESDPALGGIPLSPLLLQPLIENSIKHGIEPFEEGGRIDVSVKLREGNLQITVADTGSGINSQQVSPGSGTGLRNIRDRLRILYENHANLALKENQPQGTIACITLPVNDEITTA